jgi:hypothetical protein
MPQIERCDIIVALIDHRPQQHLNPLWRDAPQIGIDDSAGIRVEPPRDFEDGPKRAALPGNTVIGCHDSMEDALAIGNQELLIVDCRVSDNRRGVVRRSSV